MSKASLAGGGSRCSLRCACGPALVSVGREGAPSHLQARDFAHRMEVFGSRRSLEAHCQVCRSCGGCAATNVPLSPSGTWLPGVAWTCNLFPSNTRGVMDNQKLRVEFKIMQQKLSFVYFVPGTHVTCATSLFPKRLIGTRPWGDLDAPSGPCLTGQMPGGPRPVAQRCVLTRACAGGVASRLVISWGWRGCCAPGAEAAGWSRARSFQASTLGRCPQRLLQGCPFRHHVAPLPPLLESSI